ncbi:MAG: hypothetical protein KME07_13890 [Pegethrix bostrychoides GSE-TBD4-15B]|jgi:signal transduction histidine kinase|uniref:histidine kinase n=1 Tax=Pegethrix bostrychoides GSE-TBD4-15B TaxID=2839662 RepID=A0A951PBI3_9CYAN|nr:hypothetical protein [Pegethrix bostrychoides GSE-TBD4-15B]
MQLDQSLPLESAELALQNAKAQLLVETRRRMQAEAALEEQIQQHEQALRQLRDKQAEMIQTEKMSSLRQLVAGTAHEINNPINFIQGNLNPARRYIADLLDLLHLYQQSSPLTPQIQAKLEAIDLEFLEADLPKLLNSIATGATRIHDIVRSLRTFSHLDEAEIKAVDIHAGIDSALLMLRSRFRSGAKIQIVKAYADLPLVECYPGQINQALMNILNNAVDALEAVARAAPTRALSLTVRTEALSPDWVSVAICDNGIGISPDIQPQIFDPFFTTKPVGQGTGLGLSISYQIITNRHCGKLDYSSSLGKGSQFVVMLPVQLWG